MHKDVWICQCGCFVVVKNVCPYCGRKRDEQTPVGVGGGRL